MSLIMLIGIQNTMASTRLLINGTWYGEFRDQLFNVSLYGLLNANEDGYINKTGWVSAFHPLEWIISETIFGIITWPYVCDLLRSLLLLDMC